MEITLGLDPRGEPVVLLGDDAVDVAALQAAGLAADDLADAVNHLAHGTDFEVIHAPESFRRDYLARIEREDPEAAWQEGVPRLRDYGVPDFDDVKPPALLGGRLTFSASDVFTGLPYDVDASDLAHPDYSPMPITPLPRPPRPRNADPIEVETEAEKAGRQPAPPQPTPTRPE